MRFIILFIGFISLTGSALADTRFLETAPGFFQSTSGQSRVIISQDVPGIFILETSAIDLRSFDLQTLKPGDSKSSFIAFNAELKTYDRLMIADQSYSIRGNFQLELGNLRISLDTQTPYLTILERSSQNLLGFRGLEQIIATNENLAVGLLEANQFSEFPELLTPYKLIGNTLILNGQAPSSKQIGLLLPPSKNKCQTAPDVALLSTASIENIKLIPDHQQRLKQLLAAIKNNPARKVLSHVILMRSSKDLLVGFDLQKKAIVRIVPLKSQINSTVVCKIEYLPVE